MSMKLVSSDESGLVEYRFVDASGDTIDPVAMCNLLDSERLVKADMYK